jgi:hypothetical protein
MPTLRQHFGEIGYWWGRIWRAHAAPTHLPCNNNTSVHILDICTSDVKRDWWYTTSGLITRIWLSAMEWNASCIATQACYCSSSIVWYCCWNVVMICMSWPSNAVAIKLRWQFSVRLTLYLHTLYAPATLADNNDCFCIYVCIRLHVGHLLYRCHEYQTTPSQTSCLIICVRQLQQKAAMYVIKKRTITGCN